MNLGVLTGMYLC